MPTPTQYLVDLKLGEAGPLERFVHERRASGIAWRLISRELYDLTGVDVTYETLRRWHPDTKARTS